MCNELINVANDIPTNMTNVTDNLTSTLSINSNDQKVRYKMDCYVLYTF